MADSENALAIPQDQAFKMPQFGSRVEYLKAELEKLNSKENISVIKNTEIEATKFIHKMADCISEGTATVSTNQQDITEFIAAEHAKIKQKELKGKLTKMAVVDNIYSYKEAMSKIDYLDKNLEVLKTSEKTKIDNSMSENPSVNSNMKIKELESELGVQLIEGEQNVATLKDPMRETKNTFMKNKKQAEEFVNKIKNEKKELKNKLRSKQQKELEKYKQLEESRKNAATIRAEKLKAEKEKRRQDHLKRKEEEKLIQIEREKEWKKLQSKIKNTKYMHEKLEEEYQQNVLMPELEKKKNELKEKRDFYKPIDRKEIDEFQKQYEENIKLKNEEKRHKREQWYSDIGGDNFDPNRLKTKIYDKVMEEDKGNQDMRSKKIEDRTRRQEKMNNYARIVKEMHWPTVSHKKKQEIEQIKNLLGQRNQRKSAPPNKRFGAQKPNESGFASDSNAGHARPNWKKFHNPMIPKPKMKREPVVVDYLREIRVKREENDSKSKNTTAFDSEGMGKVNMSMFKDQNIDDKTKVELLKARTKLIEENAMRKEQMNKINGDTIEDNADINDMLIDAIEMKLSILDQID
ncbi:unnamed protein product [Moneuplotes crassus]|uniref:Uncharacterized protein n=1 Tax=Euplotes crassus TaxID=5936 RepID=A0AAD1X990_EUPCR|nr:unnamed protein product [Moneuplotes crassus]